MDIYEAAAAYLKKERKKTQFHAKESFAEVKHFPGSAGLI